MDGRNQVQLLPQAKVWQPAAADMVVARTNSAGAHFSADEYWITGGHVSSRDFDAADGGNGTTAFTEFYEDGYAKLHITWDLVKDSDRVS